MNSVTIPMTREQFEAEKAKCATAGFKITSDEGKQEGIPVPFGMLGLSWKYDGAALKVTVLHKPFLDPMASVLDEIRKDLS